MNSFWTGGSKAHTDEIRKRYDASLAALSEQLKSAETAAETDKLTQLIKLEKAARQTELDNSINKVF